MAVISSSDLTFNGYEIKEISEALFTGAFAKPDIAQFHDIVEGIVAKKQIVILGRINGLLGKGTNACSESDATNTVTNTEKFWDPAYVSDRLAFCWKDLQGTFFIWGAKKGIAKGDLTSTDLLIYLEELVKDAIIETVYRLAYFGDTAAANYNSSPAGVVTNGTDLAYFDKIDGIWKQLFAIVSATASRKTAGFATNNAAASFALQAFSSTDTTNKVATTTLQNMRYGADMRLRSATDLIYVVTQSVYDQYERELIASNVAFTTERLENGLLVLKSGGIEVVAFQLWDRMITTYFSNGTKYYLPHRAILTTKTNLKVGVEEVGSLGETDVWYDKTLNKTYLKFAFGIDAVVAQDELVQLAY